MTDTTTTTPDLLAEAQRLEALIDEHAAEGDERGRLSDPVVDALHDARIFGMWVPKELGGSELDPVSSLKVIDQLAYADPSTGWVTMAAGLAIGTGAAYLGDQAVEEIFGGERFPVIAGQGTRPGTAVAQDGGHLLSGSWQFASGIKHSGFIHTLGVVEGTGEPRIFVLPVEQATLIDNWDVMGLRATGSIDYEIDSVFVPEHFSHFAVTETPERGGDLYRLGIINIAGICHSGWALGIARRLIDELAKMVQAKAGRPGRAGREPELPGGLRARRGHPARGARADLRDLDRRDRDARARREPVGRPEHEHPPGHDPRHVGGARGREVRLRVVGDHRAALGQGPAALPRHARGHPARDPVAAHPADDRAQARRARRRTRSGSSSSSSTPEAEPRSPAAPRRWYRRSAMFLAHR